MHSKGQLYRNLIPVDCEWWSESRSSGAARAILSEDRVSLDLDQHRGIDEGLHLHHRGRRRARGEELAVRAAVVLPARDVGDEHARSHDAGPVGAELLQRALDELQAAPGLGVA